MELTEFKDALKNELVKRGVSEDIAATGVAGLTKTITEEKRVMIERISSSDDLGHFADALARKIAAEQKAAAQKAAEQKAAAQKAAEQKAAAQKAAEQKAAAQKATEQKAEAQRVPKTEAPKKPARPVQDKKPTVQPTAQFKAQNKRVSESTMSFVPAKPNGMQHKERAAQPSRSQSKPAAARTSDKMDRGDKIFLAVLIIGAPLWFLAVCIMSIPLAICYVGIVLMMAVCIILLTAIAAVGVAVSLIGIVYGIIKLFTVPVEGAYELGLAAIIGGSAMLVCILLYNLAVRYIPRLFPVARQLLSLEAAKITDIYYYVKKVCHNI